MCKSKTRPYYHPSLDVFTPNQRSIIIIIIICRTCILWTLATYGGLAPVFFFFSLNKFWDKKYIYGKKISSLNSTTLSKIFQFLAKKISFFFPRNLCDKKKRGEKFLLLSVNYTNVSKIFQCFSKFSNVFFFLEIFVRKKWGIFLFFQCTFH